MSTFRELPSKPLAAPEPRVTPIREAMGETVQRKIFSAATSVHDEQIHGLMQQLFFRDASRPVRHVAFAPVEGSTSTATLCLDLPARWLPKGVTTSG